MVKELSTIIDLTAGKNVSRLGERSEKDIYTQSDFDNDLQGVNDGEIRSCIINLMRTKAAPLTEKSSNKCLTTNFVLCTFDNNELDPWYFCYLFNESRNVERQVNMFQQGSMLSVKKLTLKNIGDLTVEEIGIDKQRRIGNLYKE